MRQKIHLTLDTKTLIKVDYISSKLYISKGNIFDALIKYALKVNLQPTFVHHEKSKITTTVNPLLWEDFKTYADSNNYKYNILLDAAMQKQYKSYLKKIQAIEKSSHSSV